MAGLIQNQNIRLKEQKQSRLSPELSRVLCRHDNSLEHLAQSKSSGIDMSVRGNCLPLPGGYRYNERADRIPAKEDIRFMPRDYATVLLA